MDTGTSAKGAEEPPAMVPATYHAFFGGCAGVAGTLIGLLFVAISVSPHKDVGSRAPLAFQVQAGVAITTLVNALIVALVALLPGQSLGTAVVILAVVGLSATVGLIVVSFRNWPGRHDLWGLLIIPVLGVLYALQLRGGIDLLQHPRNPSPVHFQALLVIIFFIVAIGRAWQMIGARHSGLLAAVSDLLRERLHEQTTVHPDTVDEDMADLRQSTEEQPVA
jgi:hypothetical protein